MDSQKILALLDEHPELKERVIQLLMVATNAEGNVELADDAEQRVIDELRRMGHDVLQVWATRQERVAAERAQNQKPSLRKHEKKRLSGTLPTEKSK